MKVVFTMEEVRTIIREAAHSRLASAAINPNAAVRFIHRYDDGSGFGDADAITPVERVEVDVEGDR